MRRLACLIALGTFALTLAALPAAADPPGARRLEVMSRNLYVGADIFRVLGASTPEDIPIVVAEVLQTVFDTDFPARAEKLADEVQRYRPHIIGLQEVSLIRVQSPGDFLIGNPQHATTVLLDYQKILLDALEARGLDYRVAASVEDSDVELPYFAGLDGQTPLFDDVRLTDHDVILARGDVDTADAADEHYSVYFQVTLPAPFVGTIDFLRGYAAVDATVLGRTFRFVDTHLEVGSLGPIQSLQAGELIADLSTEALPVILVGDFNSGPADSSGSPYDLLTTAGYVDTWTRRMGRPEDGFTCCQTETLDNPVSMLDERIDLVWARTGAVAPPFDEVGPVKATVTGDALRDRTSSGLWPSDHGGVVTSIILPW